MGEWTEDDYYRVVEQEKEARAPLKKALEEILAIANSIRANYSTTDIDYSMGVDSRIEDIELLAKEALDG